MDYFLVLGFVIFFIAVYLKVSDPIRYNEIKQNLLNWFKE
nr:hypothetical protein [uncultured Mediterranean phage uvMED]